MIERYSTEQMKEIWNDRNRIDLFFMIEDLVLEAMTKYKLCPVSVFKKRKKNIKFDLNRIKEIEKETRHDILAFLEFLEEKKYVKAEYLHKGMTSSDLLDTATGLQVKQSREVIKKSFRGLHKVLFSLAKKYKGFPCIGRTHYVHAEPTTLGLRFLNWHSELYRSGLELLHSFSEAASGKISGAVGNYSNLDPRIERFVLKKLKLEIESPATQVVPRDRLARLVSNSAIFLSVLERITVDIRLLHSTELSEVCEGFAPGQKGSSAMPHKKNPVSCERVSGIARIVRGFAGTAMENIPLWLERDISHSSAERIMLPGTMHLLHFAILDLTRILKNLNITRKRIKDNLAGSGHYLFSGRLLTALMNKKFSRRRAYEFIQELVSDSRARGMDFKKYCLQSEKLKKKFKNPELNLVFDLEDYLKSEDKIFKQYKDNLEKIK